MTSALTSSLIIENNKAKGIKAVNSSRFRKSFNQEEQCYYAGKEVILCGGAINTPQILQLSGIGKAEDLKGANVDCILNSEGIGAHLQGTFDQN